MLIANRTTRAVTVELTYRRLHYPTKTRTKETVTVQVDDGPEIIRRALDVLAVQLDTWNAKDDDWKYYTE